MYFTRLLTFLVTVIHGQAAYFDNYDYCKIPCETFVNAPHFKCERKDCGPDRAICNEFEAVEITDKLKHFILDEHNKLRNKVANGEEKQGVNGPQPEASNMMALKYNDEIASIAQCLANTCQFRHSTCNIGKKLPWAGQNIGNRFHPIKHAVYSDLEGEIKNIIMNWYDEVKHFNHHLMKPYRFNPGYAHYTLMVWGDIQEIGCGISKYKEVGMYYLYMVCNYASAKEAGNIIDKEMYKVGRPCTACPNDIRCNSKYNGLCGEDTLDLRDADGEHKTRKSCIKH